MRLDDPAVVAAGYAERLRVWRVDGWAVIEGEDPWEALADALAEISPRRVLDAGCREGGNTRLRPAISEPFPVTSRNVVVARGVP